MRIFRIQSVLAMLFLAVSFVACSSDDNNGNETPQTISRAVNVTAISGPATGKIGVDINYDISFIVDNACGQFDRISNISIGKEEGFQVEAKYPIGTCANETPTALHTVYTFSPQSKGTFEIKFKKSETEFLVKTLVIQ
ncbi:hypothetical protein [Flavobacterium johnsoniae]|jgi:hypothetical protein|uniref:Hypothetical lipoprotein n=1 Tax=Flavobacterium johnsoniae (strain ATCC 17061 / DSM 2064 / JCM 8514 / BCRC 14874 / CCUG 350202 / NBRC 14942 / NCIMB 11054 / UW101) TaxID=376686 RepID=A5FEE3_FLAJ1|nr:hypothetical protein [Flavobacterium johnsoniae]ABQ06431.1 hypothetical lipoprotein [Flavobacterium johnsoniae UW101]OXE98107.1 hypothetical protein B0A63_15935 [Flavobacterium johnsoniae UW101]WQG82181.1 hypothetical protein SR927_03510 [Flavobacterium johnsoniae UW101]SHK75212.1 hypothetical protein SAMN05444146_2160 [Flavobacterium johnsoniae]